MSNSILYLAKYKLSIKRNTRLAKITQISILKLGE